VFKEQLNSIVKLKINQLKLMEKRKKVNFKKLVENNFNIDKNLFKKVVGVI
jgi:hypothetical protein